MQGCLDPATPASAVAWREGLSQLPDTREDRWSTELAALDAADMIAWAIDGGIPGVAPQVPAAIEHAARRYGLARGTATPITMYVERWRAEGNGTPLRPRSRHHAPGEFQPRCGSPGDAGHADAKGRHPPRSGQGIV
jgi:hypothetical protein